MPATLVIPTECLEHLDVLDRLLDKVWDLGGAQVRWGPLAQHRHKTERVYVEIHGLPGRDTPLRKKGTTLNAAAWAVLQYEFMAPDPEGEG
jgi:hypothetical protein